MAMKVMIIKTQAVSNLLEISDADADYQKVDNFRVNVIFFIKNPHSVTLLWGFARFFYMHVLHDK